jgi:hypothetical protein
MFLVLTAYKSASMNTDGGASMTDKDMDFSLCAQVTIFSRFLTYHRIIYQHALCSEIFNMRHIDVCVKNMNPTRGSCFQTRIYRPQLEENEPELGELFCHADFT